jgi:hypothetical protein
MLYRNGMGYVEHQSTIAIDSRLSRDQLAVWLRERRIDAALEQAVAPVIAAFEAVQRLADRGARIDDEVERIFADQERVRENLGTLGQGPDESALRLRYVQRLEQQEKRLDALRAEKTPGRDRPGRGPAPRRPARQGPHRRSHALSRSSSSTRRRPD